MKKLTKTELEIMKLLWRENRPLSAPEILELSVDRSWKENSLYPMLTHLQDKGAIEAVGFVPVGKKYARTFMPKVSQEAYFTAVLGEDSDRLSAVAFLSAMLQNDDLDDAAVAEMEAMLAEYKARKGK